MSFVAVSRFSVANGTEGEVKAAFRDGAHLVDSEPGFQRLEVLSSVDHPNEIWLLTFWTERDAFERWHPNHRYEESHRCEVQDTGVNTSTDALTEQATRLRPTTLYLSLSLPEHVLAAIDVVESIRSRQSELRVVVGGIPFEYCDDLLSAIGADETRRTISDAVGELA